MKYLKKPCFLFCRLMAIGLLALCSCQKVIDVDLNSSSPKIVIEGNVNDSGLPAIVKISRTVNFDQSNVFPPVSGANVRLTDNAGFAQTLNETSPGVYQTGGPVGTPGRTYMLSVTAAGTTYTASSTMPAAVPIQDLSVINGPFNSHLVQVRYHDPAGVANYYRFVMIKNGAIRTRSFLVNDRGSDGETVNHILFGLSDSLGSGDRIQLDLQCVDRDIYEYFTALDRIIGEGAGQSLAPANPPTNFTNQPLGYFSAYSVRSQNMIVP